MKLYGRFYQKASRRMKHHDNYGISPLTERGDLKSISLFWLNCFKDSFSNSFHHFYVQIIIVIFRPIHYVITTTENWSTSE